MPYTKSILLSRKVDNILSILKNIIDKEGDSPLLIDYPVLIGSRAAKWHALYFREPNDWDLVATLSQSTSFISKVRSSVAFKDIKLIYYPEGGLKIIGECTEPSKDRKSIIFDIELISDKVDLRKMKPDEALDEKESVKENYEKENDAENNMSLDEDEINKIEFEMFKDVQPKISALMILELCCNIEDKIPFNDIPHDM